jgi:O-antigen ligase
MSAFFRTTLGQISLCCFVASSIILPALYLGQFSLAVIAMTVLSLAILLFTRPLYALLAYVMLIPFEELAVFAALGTPTRLAGMLFFAAYLFHRRFQINLRVVPLVAWLWLGWVTLSLLWSPTLRWDFYFQLVQLFLATVLIADYVSREPKRMNTILTGYTLSALVIALFGIYNFFSNAGNVSGFSFESRTSGINGQGVETFAFSLIPAFLTSFHRVIYSRQRLRWLYLLLMLVFALGMILSGTRGSWVATLGAIFLVYLPRLKARHYLVIIATVALGVGIASQIPVIAEFASYRAGSALSSGGEGRIAIWQVSWQMFLGSPVTGIGWRMGEFEMSLQDLERTRQSITWSSDGGRFVPRVAHNIYLQTLLELGVIGFILFMFWLVPLVTAPLHKDPELRELWLVSLAIFAAMLVGGLTNPEFHKKYYWFALALPQGLRYYWLLKQSRQGINTLANPNVYQPTPKVLPSSK